MATSITEMAGTATKYQGLLANKSKCHKGRHGSKRGGGSRKQSSTTVLTGERVEMKQVVMGKMGKWFTVHTTYHWG